MPDFSEDLKNRKTTRIILWEEYRQQVPEGYSRSQICEHLGMYLESRKATVATVSAQNAPKAKTSTEKVVSEKSDKAACTTDKKDVKAGCSSKADAAKAGCATPCSSEKAKACCSKGASANTAKPVPASDKK